MPWKPWSIIAKSPQISEVFGELGKIESSIAGVVDLKFFCGLSFGEIATMQNMSQRTVQRSSEKARIYLHLQNSGDFVAVRNACLP